MDMTIDQEWCIEKAKEAKRLNAPTVEALLRDAASDPDKATICRQEMSRASRAAKAINRRPI